MLDASFRVRRSTRALPTPRLGMTNTLVFFNRGEVTGRESQVENVQTT